MAVEIEEESRPETESWFEGLRSFGRRVVMEGRSSSMGMGTTKLENVIVPFIDARYQWDIEIANGKVISQTRAASTSCPSLLLPPLCHPHIHLDKPYILTSNHPPSDSHPDYSDLAPKTGTFAEALANTSAAKTRYTPEDLYLRGSQLLAESCGRHGVTYMRVFVEVDHAVGFKTIETAIRLKQDFAHLIRIQICVFAQDPICSGIHGEENQLLMQQALDRYSDHIEALGTTPYVEQGKNPKSKSEAEYKNIEWAISTALRRGIHLDFHLDYNLDDQRATSVFNVVSQVQQAGWMARVGHDKVITIGHCTQLTTHTLSVMQSLANQIKTLDLPIHFVGLPTSDLFMMGRPAEGDAEHTTPHQRPRGTLQVPSMIRDCGLNACIGVNNVGNAFTPYGDGDPLQLACWGTGIYQAGTPADAELLYECISDRARRAIGLLPPKGSGPMVQDVPVPGLLIRNFEEIVLPGKNEDGKALTVPARPRLSIKDVVWDPPDSLLRRVIK